MLDGIKSGTAGANRGDIATLLYNTLPARFVRYDKDGALDFVAKAGEKDVYDTLLSRLGASEYKDGKAFVVKGTEDSIINLKEYQGAYVTAYQNDDKEIIAIEEVKSVFLSGDFNSDASEFETDDVTYDVVATKYEDGSKPVKIVNGKVDKDDETIANVKGMEDVTIAAKVSGKKIKEIYSVAQWNGEDVKQATSAMIKNIEKNDYITSNAKFPLNDDNEVDYDEFILLGVKKVSDIEKDDVLTIYKNGSTITKLEVGTKVVTGKISKVTSNSEKITVNGDAYKMYDGSKFTADAGDEVELTLTYGGKVFALDEVSGKADKYAIAMKVQASENDDKIDTTDAKIKLFLADGTEKVFLIDEDEVEFNKMVSNGDVEVGSVIKYDTNKDNEINALEVVTASAEKASGETLTKRGTFANYKVADDAVIFVTTTVAAVDVDEAIIAELDNDDDYSVTTKAKLLDKDIDNAAYVVDEDTDEIVFMLIDNSTTTDAVYGVITDKYKVDTDAGYEFVVMIDGAEKKFECDSKNLYAKDFSDKVLYEFKFDASGYIDDIVVFGGEKTWASDEYTIAKDAEKTVEMTNGRVKYEGVNKLLADDAIVYVWNSDDEVWTLGDTSDFDGADDITVQFYTIDTTDKNEIDFVVIH